MTGIQKIVSQIQQITGQQKKMIPSMGFVLMISSAFIVTGCASSAFKARLDQRDKVAASSGLFCDFVNGDEYTDVAVELNLQMANRCDTSKHFSISSYKNASEMRGVLYCCQSKPKEEKKPAPKVDAAAAAPIPAANVGSPSAAPAADKAPAKKDDKGANKDDLDFEKP